MKDLTAMKNTRTPALLLLLLIPIAFAGCGLIVGVIKGAFWLGVIFVVLVIALIWWLVSKMRGPRV
jgi:hypothetical protein